MDKVKGSNWFQFCQSVCVSACLVIWANFWPARLLCQPLALNTNLFLRSHHGADSTKSLEKCHEHFLTVKPRLFYTSFFQLVNVWIMNVDYVSPFTKYIVNLKKRIIRLRIRGNTHNFNTITYNKVVSCKSKIYKSWTTLSNHVLHQQNNPTVIAKTDL